MVELIPVTQAAKRTSITDAVLRIKLRAGQIEGLKLGTQWFITPATLKELEIRYPLEPLAVGR